MLIRSARFGGLIDIGIEDDIQLVFSQFGHYSLPSVILRDNKMTECGRNVLVYQNRKNCILLGNRYSG